MIRRLTLLKLPSWPLVCMRIWNLKCNKTKNLRWSLRTGMICWTTLMFLVLEATQLKLHLGTLLLLTKLWTNKTKTPLPRRREKLRKLRKGKKEKRNSPKKKLNKKLRIRKLLRRKQLRTRLKLPLRQEMRLRGSIRDLCNKGCRPRLLRKPGSMLN